MSMSNFVILVSMTAGIFLPLFLILRDIAPYVIRLNDRSLALAVLMDAPIWGALWLILVGFELMVRMCLGLVPERYAVVGYFLLGGCGILGILVLLLPHLDRYLGPDEVEL